MHLRFLIYSGILLLHSPQSIAQHLTQTPWQLHGGEGLVPFGFTSVWHGSGEEYAFATIPPPEDPGWQAPPNPEPAGFNIPSTLCGQLECRTGAEFTYLQTFVNIPANVQVATFSIAYYDVDDGARTTIFNSQYPDGVVVPGSYVLLGGSGTANLASVVVPGELNRVVVTHVDDCCSSSRLSISGVVLNGYYLNASRISGVALMPGESIRSVGEEACFLATVVDELGRALGGAPVQFAVTGANNLSATARTGADGTS